MRFADISLIFTHIISRCRQEDLTFDSLAFIYRFRHGFRRDYDDDYFYAIGLQSIFLDYRFH